MKHNFIPTLSWCCISRGTFTPVEQMLLYLIGLASKISIDVFKCIICMLWVNRLLATNRGGVREIVPKRRGKAACLQGRRPIGDPIYFSSHLPLLAIPPFVLVGLEPLAPWTCPWAKEDRRVDEETVSTCCVFDDAGATWASGASWRVPCQAAILSSRIGAFLKGF